MPVTVRLNVGNSFMAGNTKREPYSGVWVHERSLFDKPSSQIGKLLILVTIVTVIVATLTHAKEIDLARSHLEQTRWGAVFMMSGLFFLSAY